MRDYTKELPEHVEKIVGERELFLQIFEGGEEAGQRPPLLFVHGAFTGSWMWSKYIPHFVRSGWTCYVMNLRSHYRSRVMDMTRITFEDYLEDMKEIMEECGAPPILVGFSMGGILSQKVAETAALAGLVLIDSSICREVHEQVPYRQLEQEVPGLIVPPPAREEETSVDESADDIAFQRKYLAMESALAFSAFAFRFGSAGISVDGSAISCPCLIIGAVNGEDDQLRGEAAARHLKGVFLGLRDTTHTGLLVGQRYKEAVDGILEWLHRYW